jgi:5'-phosphate synthase pdxT subunit
MTLAAGQTAMKNTAIKIGILSLQGDVIEHEQAAKQSLENLKVNATIILVRTKEDTKDLTAVIIPGGESTVLQKLIERAGIFDDLRRIKNIFGTCAGAILLAKSITNKAKDQKSLQLMDIEVNRNAYGRQNYSFEENINTKLGKINAVFIRAPGIQIVGKHIAILAKYNNRITACGQRKNDSYYLATCFHPELR